MTSVMDTQKENVTKAFYAIVGAPMVTGRKFVEFGTNLLTETSLDDLENAGRELTGAIRESRVAEQIQESVDLIQEAKVIEQLQVRVDREQFQDRVEVLREQLETELHNWREQFTPGVAGPKPVKVDVEAEEPAPAKKTTAKKTTTKKTTTAEATGPKKAKTTKATSAKAADSKKATGDK